MPGDGNNISLRSAHSMLDDAVQSIFQARFLIDKFTSVGCDENSTDNVAIAATLYAARRKRESLFSGSDVFHDPAWDILLELYIAHTKNRRLTIKSVSIGSQAPPTTALRYLDILEKDGYVERAWDEADNRRVFVTLTKVGLEFLDKALPSYATVSAQAAPMIETA